MSSATATALKTVLRQEMRKILSDLPAETVRRESKPSRTLRLLVYIVNISFTEKQ